MLVLGAGASRPFGFPLGFELKRLIIDKITGKKNTTPLVNQEFSETLISSFGDALRFGTHTTVDTFLEKKTNFRDLGSFFIADTIMPLERDDQLFPGKDWYGDLFKTLEFEKEDPDTSALSVVTLNYDRSFEHFLKMNIEYNCQHKRVEYAHVKREKIKVVHAHGSLGPYSDISYGFKDDYNNALRRAAKSIKIMSDHLDESPDFQEAQTVISQAKHIIFLGFGYHMSTLSELFPKSNLVDKKFYGTAFGLDDDDKKKVTDFFKNQITLGGNEENCGAFLKNIGLIR